jgi:hypothetical protein
LSSGRIFGDLLTGQGLVIELNPASNTNPSKVWVKVSTDRSVTGLNPVGITPIPADVDDLTEAVIADVKQLFGAGIHAADFMLGRRNSGHEDGL